MTASLTYRSASVYEMVMRALYGRHYSSRFRAIADLVPAGSTVLDVCCGPGRLYTHYLRSKGVDYTGIDLNPRFAQTVSRTGARGLAWDLRSTTPLPEADIAIMQASLYHFLPDPSPIVNRMLEAARDKVIISEPIRNLADSKWRLVSFAGQHLTNAGTGAEKFRFTESSLDRFMSRFDSRIEQSFLIPGGREKVFVLRALRRG